MAFVNMLMLFLITALTLKIHALPVEPVFYDDENFYVVNVPAEQNNNNQLNTLQDVSTSIENQETEEEPFKQSEERRKRSADQDSVIDVLSGQYQKTSGIALDKSAGGSPYVLEAGTSDMVVSENRVFRPLFVYRKTLLKKSS